MTNLVTQPKELILVAQARQALEQAKTIDEVKLIRDKAEALRGYAKQAGDSLELQQAACEVKIRAERKAGAMLAASVPKGRPAKKDTTMGSFSLADIGITNNQSSRWQLIASVPEDAFEKHIAEVLASEKELTSAGVRKLASRQSSSDALVAEANAAGGDCVTSLAELIDRGLKFSTVYADPPWAYGNQATRAATDNHYETLSLDTICAEPVSELVADNAHLHLWTTNGFLFDAKRVMESWGFEYKSCFVWVKPKLGIGNYWRVSHEFLLLGVRGSMTFRDKSLKSWGEFARGKHSRKPYQVRDLIEKASPGPYLEMYGRESMAGSEWTVYGNQIAASLL